MMIDLYLVLAVGAVGVAPWLLVIMLVAHRARRSGYEDGFRDASGAGGEEG